MSLHKRSRTSLSAEDQRLEQRKRVAAVVVTLCAVAVAMRKERAPRRPAKRVSWKSVCAQFTDDEFRRRYRLTRDEFASLFQRIAVQQPSYLGKRRNRLSPRLRLASTLRFLAGGSAIDVADLHGQRSAAFYQDFWETIAAINATESLGIDWQDETELEKMELECSCGVGKGTYRCVVGYVDGIVFRIEKPRQGSTSNVGDFRCERKKMWGINTQVVCDANMRIIVLFAVTTGSNAHDSTALRATALGHLCDEGLLPAPYVCVAAYCVWSYWYPPTVVHVLTVRRYVCLSPFVIRGVHLCGCPQVHAWRGCCLRWKCSGAHSVPLRK